MKDINVKLNHIFFKIRLIYLWGKFVDFGHLLTNFFYDQNLFYFYNKLKFFLLPKHLVLIILLRNTDAKT